MEFIKIDKSNIEIAAQIFKDGFTVEPWFEEWTDETAIKRISQIMRCEGSRGFIAYRDGVACAMIVGHEEDYYDGTRFLIKEFCVASNAKGGGIGTKLLNFYLEGLKEEGIVQVSLYTMREQRILRFYEKSGFKEIEDLVMMEIFNQK